MANGRDNKGRFAKGNQYGRGNGGRKKAEFAIQALIDEEVSEDDWRKMIKRRREVALGEVLKASAADEAKAFSELADRRWGKAKESVEHSGEVRSAIDMVLALHQARQDIAEMEDGNSNSAG